MPNTCLVITVSLVLFVACSGTSAGSGASDGGADGSSDDASPEAGAGAGGEGGSGAPHPPPSKNGGPPSTSSGGDLSDSDSGTKEPSWPACTSGRSRTGPQDRCTLESTYQCETPSGFDAFRVACSCPSATCGCYTNGTLTKTVAFDGCPDCTSPVELAKLCGVAGY